MLKSRYLFIVLISILPAFAISCIKKELDQFKNLNFQQERDYAFPLFESTLTLKNALPFAIPAITLSDTISTDFRAGSYLGNYSGNVEYVEFKLILKSNFPVTGAVQFYFANAQNQIVDSLFTYNNSIIQASTGDYKETTLTVYMDKAKYKKIEQAPKVQIRYMLVTTEGSNYASNQLQINSGIRFGITF